MLEKAFFGPRNLSLSSCSDSHFRSENKVALLPLTGYDRAFPDLNVRSQPLAQAPKTEDCHK